MCLLSCLSQTFRESVREVFQPAFADACEYDCFGSVGFHEGCTVIFVDEELVSSGVVDWFLVWWFWRVKQSVHGVLLPAYAVFPCFCLSFLRGAFLDADDRAEQNELVDGSD